MKSHGRDRQRRKIILTVGASCLLVLCLLYMSFLIFDLYQNGRKEAKEPERVQAVNPEKEEQDETESVKENQNKESADTEEIPDADRQNEAADAQADPQTAENSVSKRVEELIANLTTEQKVAQLFFVLPDSLAQVSGVTQVGETTASAYRQYPVGGIVYMENNIVSEEQLTGMNAAFVSLGEETVGAAPFLSVDEEGGSVTRIAQNPAFPVTDVGNMADIGSTQDPQLAYQAGVTLGTYLRSYGFDVDFAPVADVLVNPSNTVVRSRSFGSDPSLVAEMVTEEVRGLHEQGLSAALKHFPGHGATAEDSHEGYAYADRSLEQLRECELIPFQAGIDAGADFVMVGHLCYPQIDGSGEPTSISSWAVTQLLKEEMGFSGIAITDAMNMGAIVNHYSSGEAAVRSIQAGMDMILMPADFYSAYDSVLEAVNNGSISQERLRDALTRILTVKLERQGE